MLFSASDLANFLPILNSNIVFFINLNFPCRMDSDNTTT